MKEQHHDEQWQSLLKDNCLRLLLLTMTTTIKGKVQSSIFYPVPEYKYVIGGGEVMF